MTSEWLPDGATIRAQGLIALRPLALSATPSHALAALPGGFPTRRKGAGLEPADVREYVPGDDIRTMDRGATARTGTLHVRLFREERDRVALLVADFRPQMFWGLKRAFRSVAAAEILSLIGWQVVESGGRVGLLAVSSEGLVVVPPRARVRGMLDVIRGMVDSHRAGLGALAAARSPGDTRLDHALLRAERLVPSGSEIFVASGFDRPGPDLGDNLAALSRRRRLSLMLVTSGPGGRLPQGLYPVRLEDGRRMRLRVTGDGLGDGSGGSDEVRIVGGHRAAVIDAGLPVETIAARLAGGGLREAAA
ncbi:DUF58 domain-containing protein [Sulfitobacter sp. LCG007]